MTATLTFEDVHQHSASGYYTVPNERLDTWRNYVKGLRIDRAGAICSAGEVGFFAILPTARKEVVLLDHSYASLSVAMLKWLVLRDYGAAEAKRMFTKADAGTLRKTLDNLLAQLPDKVREQYDKKIRDQGFAEDRGDFVAKPTWWTHPRCRECRGYGGKLGDGTSFYPDYPGVTKCKACNGTGCVPIKDEVTVHKNLAREWEKLPIRTIRHCAVKLDKVKFVHGDLVDFEKHGKFDLLYISNALSHGGRNVVDSEATNASHSFYSSRPRNANFDARVEALLNALNPGGYILAASSSLGSSKFASKLKRVKRSCDSKDSFSWDQELYQVK